MKFGPWRAAATLVGLFIGMASAGPVKADTFSFSFINANPIYGGGATVTGTVVLNATDTAATSLTIDSNTGGFGLGQYVGTPSINSFTVVSGQITAFTFEYLGSLNTAPAVTCCSLLLESVAAGSLTGLTNQNNLLAISGSGQISFTPLSTVPLPTTLPLFATGLGALGLLGWRRKRKTQAD